jgi:hypothetical protein
MKMKKTTLTLLLLLTLSPSLLADNTTRFIKTVVPPARAIGYVIDIYDGIEYLETHPTQTSNVAGIVNSNRSDRVIASSNHNRKIVDRVIASSNHNRKIVDRVISRSKPKKKKKKSVVRLKPKKQVVRHKPKTKVVLQRKNFPTDTEYNMALSGRHCIRRDGKWCKAYSK